MFIPPAMAGELARQRHRDLVACAARYRLSHQVRHPSKRAGMLGLRASLVRLHLLRRVHA